MPLRLVPLQIQALLYPPSFVLVSSPRVAGLRTVLDVLGIPRCTSALAGPAKTTNAIPFNPEACTIIAQRLPLMVFRTRSETKPQFVSIRPRPGAPLKRPIVACWCSCLRVPAVLPVLCRPAARATTPMRWSPALSVSSPTQWKQARHDAG